MWLTRWMLFAGKAGSQGPVVFCGGGQTNVTASRDLRSHRCRRLRRNGGVSQKTKAPRPSRKWWIVTGIAGLWRPLGRHWLDMAGYSDSEGKRNADMIRDHAWRYRDYVINAFNADKPYDRFLIEIAGDELVDYTDAEAVDETVIEKLVATGFLRMAPDGTSANPVNRVEDRLQVIDDELQILAGGVMASRSSAPSVTIINTIPSPTRLLFLRRHLQGGL